MVVALKLDQDDHFCTLVLGLSSWKILLWQARMVAGSECLVHSNDVTINQPFHICGEGVKGGPTRTRALEVAIFVALSTEKTIFTDSGIEEGSDGS